MKKGWEVKTLEEVADSDCSISYGIVQPGDEFADGLPVVRPTDLTTKVIELDHLKRIDPKLAVGYQRTTLHGGELLLCVRGSTGTVSIASEALSGANVTRGIVPIRFNKTLMSPAFGYYLMITDQVQSQIREKTYGAALMQINIRDLRNILLTYPPLPEQQRIVGILDKAFEGLAVAVANAEKNLQNARALFESHLQSVFTQRGEGWEETTIGDQLTLQRGFDITKEQQNAGAVPVVSSGGIKSFHDKVMAKGPGVVIGRKGTLGKVFYLENDYWPHDTTLWVKDFKGNEPRFVYYLFAGLNVKRLDSGTANPALNRNQVHPIQIFWPPVSQQRLLIQTLDTINQETQRLAAIYEKKLAALAELKKSLLHQAFSGEL